MIYAVDFDLAANLTCRLHDNIDYKELMKDFFISDFDWIDDIINMDSEYVQLFNDIEEIFFDYI